MKRVRGDEPESTTVGGKGDAPSVVAAVAGDESSSGAPAARRRAVTVAESTVPVVVSVNEEAEEVVAPAADLQNTHAGRQVIAVAPDDDEYGDGGQDRDSIDYLYEEALKEGIPFKEETSDDGTEEDSDDVDHDKEDRDRKSRFVLKRLVSGKIPFRIHGELSCPFCVKVISKNIESMIHHANGVGVGSKKKHKAHTMAKHAAFGRFLEKYVKGGLIPVVGPAVGPHALFPQV